MQRVIPDVGDSSNIMDGHSQDDIFTIAPDKLYVVRRQAHHCILLRCQLACQLMRLLRITEAHGVANYPVFREIMNGITGLILLLRYLLLQCQ